MRTQRLWKVEIQLFTDWPGRSASVRAFISPAALLVNVTARTRSEGTPLSSTRCAMRCVMTRVLPLPAPARMSTAPSVASTASRCCGFSPASSADSPVSCPGCVAVLLKLFDGDGLGQVAGLVDVPAGAHRRMVGEELQGEDHQQRRPDLVHRGHVHDLV